MKIGFMGLLTLIFIAAKLWGAISWPWYLVLLPAYGPLLVLLVFIGVAATSIHMIDKKSGDDKKGD